MVHRVVRMKEAKEVKEVKGPTTRQAEARSPRRIIARSSSLRV